MTGEDSRLRPAPGEDYNPGPETEPRQAATVILLRGREHRLEVLLVLRNPDSRFMGGVWVFPGGAVDRDEQEADGAHRRAALRELREEAGIELPAEAELLEFSRWITPAQVKIRFDTVFFLAKLPIGQEVSVDGEECVDHRWIAPAEALAAHAAGELPLVFPTIKHLEMLAGFANVTDLLEHARGRNVGPVQPKIVLDAGAPRVVLPGEPGY